MTTANTLIDATARVHPDAKLGEGVSVGPYSIIGPDVEIGAGTRIDSHAVINGHTRIGRNNRVFQFTCIGEEPQHLAYKGEPTRVEIGDGNTFREFCTVHRGTMVDHGVTTIGHNNLLMAYCHIAHDCILGDNIIIANGASLAGHVQIGDRCLFGGFAMVHQFVRVGRMAFLAYATGVSKDVPPFVRCADHQSRPHGINVVGMKRAGFGDDVNEVKRIYKLIYRSGLRLVEAREKLAQEAPDNPLSREFSEFLDGSQRGIIR